MKKENNTLVKKYIALAVSAIFVLGLLCACGGSGEDASTEATEATEAAKSTVTAEEAAKKASEENAKGGPNRVKKGTEDPAIDAAKVAAYADIEGYDGKWQNLAIDVDDTITTIEFDWNGNHYKYEYDQATRKILK